MAELPMVIRPIRDSVLNAAERLSAAQPNPGAHLPAVREATLALENHLDTLAKELQGEIEPRLLHRAHELETRLREALVLAWAIEKDLQAGPVDQARIGKLSESLRHAASQELDLVAEQLRDAAALD